MHKRKLYEKLLEEDKISIIIGPRQVGKTTLLKQLHEKLGGLYLDLDILENAEKFETYTRAIEFLKLNGLTEKKFYLFLDEFQKYDDLTKILKNIYDNHKNIKIYATGSSSIKIKHKVQESLAGRKHIHYLYPLDFEEFCLFKTGNLEKLHTLQKINTTSPQEDFLQLLEEYMIYGGYPEVVLSENKQDILRSIFDMYIRKDLVDYLKSNELIGVKKLIQYLAINDGRKLNITDIAQSLNIQRYKIEQYFEILEETFIIQKVTPFFTNKNKEITKAHKEYFIDTGARNFFLNNFNSLEKRQDVGFLFETFLFSEVRKNCTFQLKFWEDKQKHEVDLIIDKTYEQIAVEAKFKKKLKAEDYRGLTTINSAKKYLVNLSLQDEKHVLPFSLSRILK